MAEDTPVTITPETAGNDVSSFPVYLANNVAPTLPPSPVVSQKRAEKAELGLSQSTGMGQTQIRDMIQSGQEEDFRQRAASNLNFQEAQKFDQKLIDARNKKGAPLNYQEAINLVDPMNPNNARRADPNDVIEKAYSQTFISAANTAAAYMKGTVLDAAKI